MCDGMATMSHRTTFSLDKGTLDRIRSLASLWRVSQAEVVRRAVSHADAASGKADPIAMLEKLQTSGEGLSAAAAKAYLKEVREDRKQWRGQ